MNTIIEKLNLLADTKNKIKSAIEAKGVTVGNIPFADYPSKIEQIPEGSHIDDLPYMSSLGIIVRIYNKTSNNTFYPDNYLQLFNISIDLSIMPNKYKEFIFDNDTKVFDIIPEGDSDTTYNGKAYIKNGDIVSPTIEFSEYGGDYFSVYWYGPFDFTKRIEIYILD